jgi:hypothetical protein
MLSGSWISAKYFAKTKFKASIAVLKALNIPFQENYFFVSLSKKSCLGTATVTQSYHHQKSYGVRSS